MLNLNTDIRYIKGIGEAKGKAFARLGVRCVGDLLSDFPRAYEDRSKVLPIARLMEGESACVCAMITTEPELSRIRKGMELLRFRIADASGSMLVTYFNQAWMKNRLRRGDTYIFYGKVQVTGRTFAFTNPIFEPEAEMGRVTGRIMPVYRLTGGISQRDMTQAVRRVLGEPGMTFPNALPRATPTRTSTSPPTCARFRSRAGGWCLRSCSRLSARSRWCAERARCSRA